MNQKKWVDSIYNKMTLKEKVGQLFMIEAFSTKNKTHSDYIKKLIAEYHLGGLVFFQGDPVSQSQLTNEYQSISNIPLMITIDAEWGLNMRLNSTFRYPYNMTLGAVQDESLIKKIGKQIGKHCKRIGVHVNFAPVVDINTNPKNPIIGVRSYGEQKENVIAKAIEFTKGIQSENVLACAKHFPGHGDTDSDSHKTLPTVSFTAQRIDNIELYPFKQLFLNDISSVMVAHLNVPSLEKTNGLPSSLSYKVTTELLKDKLHFKGLIFTDALDMKGASNYGESGEVSLVAFKAGNDVLLLSEDIPKGISKIIEAYKNDDITEERLSHSVKKILTAKYDVGLHQYKPINISNIINDLNTEIDNDLYKEVISEAITLIKNDNETLSSIKDSKKIAYIKIGDGTNDTFLSEIKQQVSVDDLSGKLLEKTLPQLKNYNTIIISYHQDDTRTIKHFSDEDIQLIEKISKNNSVILDVFASQYTLVDLSFSTIKSVLISYENSIESQRASAQIILGNKVAKGKLPTSINTEFKVNSGITEYSKQEVN